MNKRRPRHAAENDTPIYYELKRSADAEPDVVVDEAIRHAHDESARLAALALRAAEREEREEREFWARLLKDELPDRE